MHFGIEAVISLRPWIIVDYGQVAAPEISGTSNFMMNILELAVRENP